MPSVMPPRVTIMPNYAELCYYADYAAPMQLCRFIMLASRGMLNRSDTRRPHKEHFPATLRTRISMRGTRIKMRSTPPQIS
jgi:hypothetical protein